MKTPAERVVALAAEVQAAYWHMVDEKLKPLTEEEMLASQAALESTFVARVAELQAKVEQLETTTHDLEAALRAHLMRAGEL